MAPATAVLTIKRIAISSSTMKLITRISTPISWAFWLLASISVIMIIVGGIRYITSQGNQQQLQSAKNTVLYAVVGLVVAIAARAIVMLVVDSFYS